MKAASTLDYRELARRRLPKFLFEYIDGGSYAEVTLRRNVQDLESITLRQRVLRDVGKLDLTCELFGQKLAIPVALGPIGLAGLNARRGEVQAARAAEAAGVPFCLSTMSACSLAEVARATKQPPWFQLYMIRDRAFMRDLLAQAREAQMPGTRVHGGPARARLALSRLPHRPRRRAWPARQAAPRMAGGDAAAWAWNVGLLGRPHSLGNVAPVLGRNSGLEDFFGWIRNNFDPTVTWRDLEFIRSEWRGPLIIKGVLDAEDAIAAANAGADGIVVSNHGGRQLDGVSSTARALPPIVDAVGNRMTVLADSGVRSGLDVVRMLALGAKGVLLGRAWVYALGAAGEQGVAHVLKLIEAEMRVAMALTGVTNLASIDRSILVAERR